MVSIWNRGQDNFTIEPGERIAQMVFVPVVGLNLIWWKSLKPPIVAKVASAIPGASNPQKSISQRNNAITHRKHQFAVAVWMPARKSLFSGYFVTW